MGEKKQAVQDTPLAKSAERDSFSSFEKLSLNEASGRNSPETSTDANTGDTDHPEIAHGATHHDHNQISKDAGNSYFQGTDDPGSNRPANEEASSMSVVEEAGLASTESPHSGMRELRELEEAALVAAAVTKEAASKATERLLRGAAEAKAFVSSLWSAFDDGKSTDTSRSEDKLRQRLGLDPNEAILESFRCKLIQPYRPAANDFTPVKNIAFAGELHVAAQHVVFDIDGAPGNGICLERDELEKVTRDNDVIRLVLTQSREIIIGAFSLPRLEVESAFVLLDGMVSAKTQRQSN